MVCPHIVLNGGCMFLVVYLWLLVINSSISDSIYTIQEFCSGNLYVHSIEPGEPYVLSLKTDPSSKISKWYQKSKRKCVKEFKTSDPASHFDVYISDMNIPSCPDCRCNYFQISVLGITKRFCGENKVEYFSSKSDKLSIEFHHGSTLGFDVNLTFVVERNVYIITGSSTENNYGSGNFIETPYFPHSYTPNYRAEYHIQADSNSHILLVFLDFLISHQSFIEVVGNNGTHPTKFYGNTFRPPTIVSQSNHLSLKFASSDHPGFPGFRALVSFLTNPSHLSVPNTDCGGGKTGHAGVMQVHTHEGYELYDCVWYITPSIAPFTISFLSVNIWFKGIGSKSSLELRAGTNSKSEIIKIIKCENNSCLDHKEEATVPASNDLYIRFIGYLQSSYSTINMSYSMYHRGNCSDNEFVCEDGRCLISKFRCDGVPQCPNGTDEENCSTASITPHPDDRRGALADMDDVHVFNTFLLVVVVGSFGLIAVICVTVVIFMCRYDKDPETAEGQTQQVVREMMDADSTLYSNRFDNDNLPSYEDFVKTSDSYPPLLYTRSKCSFIPKEHCIKCTNFNGDARVRLHSDTSYNVQSSESDLFATSARETSCHEQGCSNSYNVEVYNLPTSKISKNIQRSNSLDSKLDNLMKDDGTCHFYLSIMHPCNHARHHCKHVQCPTLPSNFKMAPFQTKRFTARLNPSVPDSNGNYTTKDRGFTWSFTPQSADVITVVKARCCSDPCKNISVHYSIY